MTNGTPPRRAGSMALLFLFVLAGCHPPPPSGSTSPSGTGGQDQGGARRAIRFTDVTERAGIDWRRVNGAFGKRWFPETTGGGGAFIDYDGDGYPDILLVNGNWWPGHAPANGKRPTLALYRNNHNGTFMDVTKAVGLDVACQGMGVAVGDYDNDGFDDIYVTAVGGNHLFHNEGGKRFTEVTKRSGVGGEGWSTSAAWLDYDNDGRLDLFVCHYVRWSPALEQFCGAQFKTYCTPTYYAGESCRLYHNDGNGRFTDVTRQSGVLNNNSKALGVCTVDIDRDGRPDILVANDQEPNFLYHNNGDGTFTDIAFASGFAMGEGGRPRSGMGIDAADYANDSVLGVLVGNFALQGVTLYREDQAGLFTDRARDARLLQPSYSYVTFGLLFCDFDNDGWKDAALANGQIDDLIERISPGQHYAQPPLLFQNRPGGLFDDVSGSAGLGPPMVGRGIATGDFDNDGRMDILMVPNIGPPRLLHNDTAGSNHWIKVALQGTRSNRDGFGAIVRVTAGKLTQTDTARSGSSFCSQSDRRLNFGIGAATRIDTLEVQWPSGHTDVLHALAPDRLVNIVEGQPLR